MLVGHRGCATVFGAIECLEADIATVSPQARSPRWACSCSRPASGMPVSAGLVLVAGLAGAAWAVGGMDGIVWGGMHGVRPYGVLGAALAMVVAPLLGLAAAATIGRRLWRASCCTGQACA